MATYYVRSDGSDSNSGTGYQASQAFKTIAKAVSVVSAGDTIYVAPGIYSESNISITTSGTSSAKISLIGDPYSEVFLDVKPDDVVVDSESNPVLVFAANVRYWVVTQIIFVMSYNTSSSAILANDIYTSTREIRACGIYSSYKGVTKCNVYDSFIFSFYVCVESAAVYRSILIGQSTASLGGSIYFCIVKGDVQSGKAYYSLLLSSSAGGDLINCVTTTGTDAGSVQNSLCLAMKPDNYLGTYSGCYGMAYGPSVSGITKMLTWHSYESMRLLFEAFQLYPRAFPLLGASITEKNPFNILPESASGGCLGYELGKRASSATTPAIELDYTFYKNTAPSIKMNPCYITTTAYYVYHHFTFPVKKEEVITKKIWCYHNGYNGSRPYILLTGNVVSESSATATTTSTWEQLQVSATASSNGFVYLILRARMGSSHNTWWSDLE
jgi:hypothetical protein